MKRSLPALLAIAAAAFLPTAAAAEDLETALVAGGCFWCVEADFDKVEGVVETVSGYTGGEVENPTYEQVSFSDTGHYEAVRITYDADVIGYDEILTLFWRSIDPTDPGGQFCDRGSSYRTAVFANDAAQSATAKETRAAAEAALGQEIVTPILEAGPFWPAEEYHQNYHEESPVKYTFYRRACGRDARVRQLWGDQAINARGS